jgi:hypothetical protein
MTASDNEDHYRALLEAAQKGVENGNALLEAIRASDTAALDMNIPKMVESLAKNFKQVENEMDQLWDLFKRIRKRPGPSKASGL